MASTRYIEVVSSTRNRFQFPYPGEFVIPAYCAQSGARSQMNPYSSAYPTSAWTLPPTTSLKVNGRVYPSIWPVNDKMEPLPWPFSGHDGGLVPIVNFSSPRNVWTSKKKENIIFNPSDVSSEGYFEGCRIIVFIDGMPAIVDGKIEADVETSTVVSTLSAGMLVLSSQLSLSDVDYEKAFFLLDFNHNPYGRHGLPPTLFFPIPAFNALTAGALKGFEVCEIYWKGPEKYLDKDPCEIIKRLSTSNSIELASPFNPPDDVDNVPTYLLRSRHPLFSKRLPEIRVRMGAIYEIQVTNGGSGYRIGDVIRSRPTDCDHTINQGRGLCAVVSSVGDTGQILKIEVREGGYGHRQGLYVLQVVRGAGSRALLTLSATYQTLSVPANQCGASEPVAYGDPPAPAASCEAKRPLYSPLSRIASTLEGDFVFLPVLNRLDSDGFLNRNPSFAPPLLPRYVQFSDYSLDITHESEYPPKVTTDSGNEVYPNGSAPIVSCRNEGAFTVLYLETNIPVDPLSLTDEGEEAFVGEFDNGILKDQVLEILPCSGNTSGAMTYSGSTVSQNQMVCYQITLVSILLPNIPLQSLIGGLIAFYPFVYVEFRNLSSPSSGNPGYLYSNNPYSHKALFRVNIDDTNNPTETRFVKLTGDRTSPIIKFKPNDPLFFRISLPDGTLFRTSKDDTQPPSQPDPFVQISACFSITRIV